MDVPCTQLLGVLGMDIHHLNGCENSCLVCCTFISECGNRKGIKKTDTVRLDFCWFHTQHSSHLLDHACCDLVGVSRTETNLTGEASKCGSSNEDGF